MPASLIGSTANFNLLLTSHLSLARLHFFHVPYHPGASSCLSSQISSSVKSSAVIWDEAKHRWETKGLHQFLLACPLTWAAPCQDEGFLSFFLSSSSHKLAVKTDSAVKSDDVITQIAWLWFQFSSKWKCEVEPYMNEAEVESINYPLKFKWKLEYFAWWVISISSENEQLLKLWNWEASLEDVYPRL